LIVQFNYQSTDGKNMLEEKNKEQQQSLIPWAQYQEEQTKLWLRYWTGVMNSLFNTDLKK
jgi:hypothetical protein